MAAGAQIRLFCVPYAGGSARAYWWWRQTIADGIDVVPLELPGRGSRIAEPYATSVTEAARELAQELRKRSSGQPYALLGHSLGSLIAYEAICHLEAAGSPPPELLVVSGRNPPHARNKWSARASQLSDDRLLGELSAMGQTPRGLSCSLASRFFLPVIRADLRMVQDYQANSTARQIGAPILVFAGRDDQLTDSEILSEWARYTSLGCHVRQFDGGHFFLYDQVVEVAEIVRARLRSGTPTRTRERSQ